MKVLLIALAIAFTAACGNPLEPSPVARNIVCPTGCVLPPGCYAVPAPLNYPVGYKVMCHGDPGYVPR